MFLSQNGKYKICNKFMTKKIFLTGHTGFIGEGIIRRFKSEESIEKHYLQKQKKYCLEFNYVDLNNYLGQWKKLLEDTDCVIHCAGRAHIINETIAGSFSKFHKINTESTRILAEEAAEAGVKRLIFLSSVGVNGVSTDKSKSFSYDDVPAPTENYAISKFEAEKALWKVSKKTGLEIVIIRAPLVYGEKMKGNFLRLINLIDKGFIFPFSNVKNLRSFIGLDNLVDLIVCCINHPKAVGHTFLASDGEDISTPDLIRKLSNAMDKFPRLLPFPISLIKLMGNIFNKSSEIDRLLNSLTIDDTYTREILSWKPPFSLDDGLFKTVQWYLDNR